MDQISDDDRRKLRNRLAQRRLRSKRNQACEPQRHQKHDVPLQSHRCNSYLSGSSIDNDLPRNHVPRLQTEIGQLLIQDQAPVLEDLCFESEEAISPPSIHCTIESWNEYPILTDQRCRDTGGTSVELFDFMPYEVVQKQTNTGGSRYGQSPQFKYDEQDLQVSLGDVYKPGNVQSVQRPSGDSTSAMPENTSSLKELSRSIVASERHPHFSAHINASKYSCPRLNYETASEKSTSEAGYSTHKRLDGDGAQDNSEGKTTLHLSAENGHLEAVRCILEFGTDIDVRDASGLTALHLAVEHGHTHVVKLLLEEGASIEIKDLRGWTAIHKAAAKGWEEIIKLLVRKGADLNAGISRQDVQ